MVECVSLYSTVCSKYYSALQEDETYALIAWEGEGPAHWEGRKRNAAAVAFDSKGELVGQAVSFWIAAKEQD